MSPKTVVVAVDSSPGAEIAFYNAMNFINKLDVVHIVHVRKPIHEHRANPESKARDFWAEEEKRTEAEAKAVLSKFGALASEGQVEHKLIQLAGDAREEICRYCKEAEADALVVGSRGLGTLKALLMGSVSKYCLNHAPCPVVIAKEMKKSSKTPPSEAA